MRSTIIALCSSIVVVCASAPAVAGPYADELARCLVESTTKDDRIALVQWMFTAASLHPAVEPISVVTDEDLDRASKATAELFMRLLTESCRPQTEKALQFEGVSTIETSFSVLGQVAGRELFSSPQVTAGMARLDDYIDDDELSALMPSQ